MTKSKIQAHVGIDVEDWGYVELLTYLSCYIISEFWSHMADGTQHMDMKLDRSISLNLLSRNITTWCDAQILAEMMHELFSKNKSNCSIATAGRSKNRVQESADLSSLEENCVIIHANNSLVTLYVHGKGWEVVRQWKRIQSNRVGHNFLECSQFQHNSRYSFV